MFQTKKPLPRGAILGARVWVPFWARATSGVGLDVRVNQEKTTAFQSEETKARKSVLDIPETTPSRTE